MIKKNPSMSQSQISWIKRCWVHLQRMSMKAKGISLKQHISLLGIHNFKGFITLKDQLLTIQLKETLEVDWKKEWKPIKTLKTNAYHWFKAQWIRNRSNSQLILGFSR
jgi:hypothetical protein